MEIKLTNFLCHLDRTFSFDEGLTVLTGSNGIGKSTIFLGLRWCLYGTVKDICPFTPIPKRRTEVTVKLGDIVINRKNSPSELKFTTGKQIFADEEANGIINKLFGSEDVWLSSSFMEQKEKSKLLDISNSESSNRERMSLLQKIAFGEDEPSIIIDNINSEIKDVSSEIKVLEGRVMSELSSLDMLNKTYSNVDLDDTTYSDKISVDDLTVAQSKYKKDLDELTKVYNRDKSIMIEYNLSNDRLKLLKSKLNDIPETADIKSIADELKKMENDINIISSHHDILTYGKRIQHKYNHIYDKYITIPPKLNDNDLKNALSYENGIKICNNLNVEYDSNTIKTYINNLENTIVHYEYLERQTQINELKEGIIEVKTDIDELKANISTDKSLLKLMNSLLYILQDINILCENYKDIADSPAPLTSCDIAADIVNIEDNIKEFNYNLNELNKKKDIHVKFKSLVDEIPSIFLDNAPRSISEITLELDSRKKLMKCPHCNKNVCYINKSLKAVKGSTTVKELEKELKLANIYNNIIKNLQTAVVGIIDNITKQDLLNNDIYSFDMNMYNDKVNELTSDAEIEQSVLIIARKLHVQINNYDKIITDLDKLGEDISSLKITGELHISDIIMQVKTAVTEIEEDKNISESDLEKLYNNIRINDLITKLDNIPKPKGNVIDNLSVKDAASQLSLVKSVNVVDKPAYDSEEITRIINWYKYYREFKFKCDDNSDPCVSISESDIKDKRCILDDLIRRKSSLSDEISILNKHERDREYTISSIREQEVKITSLGNIDNIDVGAMEANIKDINDKIIHTDGNIEWLKACRLIKSQKSKVNETQERITTLSNKYTILIKLRNLAVETNYQLFESALAGINDTIGEIASNLFDEPITIRIDLYKQIAKQTKPKINLVIENGGNQYKNIKRTSGGEEDRISLALCAAFSSYSKFPFIILDESFRFISHDARETCLETLKTTGKNIILISQTKGSAHANNVVNIVKQ